VAVVETLERSTATIRLGVADSRVESVRAVDETERAVRIYQAGCVGLASATGAATREDLVARARDALDVGVPYAPAPEAGRRQESRTGGRSLGLDDLVSLAEALLSGLRAEFPDLTISNAISHATSTLSLANDAGLALAHESVSTEVALTVRASGSADLFDTVIAFEAADPNPGAMLSAAREHLDVFQRTLVEPVEGPQRVIFRGFGSELSGPLAALFASDLLADAYSSGDSRFAGALESGERLLSEALTLVDRRDPAVAGGCPFDHEGFVRETLDLRLIDRGVLRAVAADKRGAHRHGLPPTGCAVGGLAELASAGLASPDLLPTVRGLPDLLEGEPGILVWLSMGGQWTPGGELTVPVQVALRLDPDGRTRGRLPGVVLRGRLFEMFGEGFLGATEDTIDPWTHHRFVGVRMDVNRMDVNRMDATIA
jgi:PmbA protein